MGFARAVDGHADGRPIGGVVALSIVVLVFGLMQFAPPPGHRSTEGSAAVRSLRDELDRYVPSARPDRTVYGPAAAAPGTPCSARPRSRRRDPGQAQELLAGDVSTLGRYATFGEPLTPPPTSGGSGGSSGGDAAADTDLTNLKSS